MKKGFFSIAGVILIMAAFAQTPQTTSAKNATVKHSSHAKTDQTNTKSSKANLSKDKSKLKSDKASNGSAQIKKR